MADLLNQSEFHELFGGVVDRLEQIVGTGAHTRRGEKTPAHAELPQ